jgi:hypothetical protein
MAVNPSASIEFRLFNLPGEFRKRQSQNFAQSDDCSQARAYQAALHKTDRRSVEPALKCQFFLREPGTFTGGPKDFSKSPFRT